MVNEKFMKIGLYIIIIIIQRSITRIKESKQDKIPKQIAIKNKLNTQDFDWSVGQFCELCYDKKLLSKISVDSNSYKSEFYHISSLVISLKYGEYILQFYNIFFQQYYPDAHLEK